MIGIPLQHLSPPLQIPSMVVGAAYAVLIHMGQLCFGLIACRRAVPDVGLLGDYLVEAAAELTRAVATS